MLRKVVKIAVTVILVLGVALLLLWDSRLGVQLRFAGFAHLPSVDSDYGNIAEIVPSKESQVVEMFGGLPHNYSDREAFADELWNSENHSIHGYRFYSTPVKFSEDFRRIALEVFTEESTFTPYAGPKLCGGYHADFAVRLDDHGQRHWFLVCFGCHEVLCFTKGAELISDLHPAAYKKLRSAWDLGGVGSTPLDLARHKPDKPLAKRFANN